jgi:hypothetical protein
MFSVADGLIKREIYKTPALEVTSVHGNCGGEELKIYSP